MKKVILFAIAAMVVFSCGKKKADDPLADTGRTQRTENLLNNLKKLSAEGYLVGHQDDTVYGIGWAFGLKKTSRIKAFVFRFISVPAKWSATEELM